MATGGTAAHLQAAGIEAARVLKIQEGRPNASDLMKNGDIAMMLITSTGDEVGRLTRLLLHVPCAACNSALLCGFTPPTTDRQRTHPFNAAAERWKRAW